MTDDVMTLEIAVLKGERVRKGEAQGQRAIRSISVNKAKKGDGQYGNGS